MISCTTVRLSRVLELAYDAFILGAASGLCRAQQTFFHSHRI